MVMLVVPFAEIASLMVWLAYVLPLHADDGLPLLVL
jgi:hypothetical protein